MKILFTTFYDPNYLGIRYLAATLKNAGHEVAICQLKDFRHFPVDPADTSSHTGYFLFSKRNFSASGDQESPITSTEMGLFEECIRSFKPDMVGFTNRSPYDHLLGAILPAIRRAAPYAFLLGGGYGPTFKPDLSLRLGADAIIRGEGEGAILDLAGALEKGEDWHPIRNMAWLDKGKVIKNPLRPLITDLDSLPFPLYYGNHFFAIEDNKLMHHDMRHQSAGGVHSSTYTILTGRGCIGNCSYCAGGNWRNQYKLDGLTAPLLRLRNLDNVMAELRLAKAQGEKFITFSDEYFVRSSKDLKYFLDDYAKEINLPFFAHFHHHQLMEEKNGRLELLEAAGKAGLITVAIGVQSACESFAKRVYHRKNNNEEILKAINIFQKHGFSGNFQIIGGNPLETDKEQEELFDFCARIPFDPSMKTDWVIHAAILRLLEGSPLAETHPELKDMEYPPAKFSEIFLLAEMRNKVDKERFERIRANSFYKNNPERLYCLLKQIIRDRHMAYLMGESERLKGREVYFWGHGDVYHYKSHLFAQSKPVCILDDTIGMNDENRIEDGLVVLHPSKGLVANLPIIIFSRAASRIANRIRYRYPQYKDVVTCVMI